MELESNPFAAPGVDAKPGPDSVVVTKSVVITLNDSSINRGKRGYVEETKHGMLGEVWRKFVGPPG